MFRRSSASLDMFPPALVGYSSGPTLVYAVLVQAPTGTFQGGISLGFCPDLQLPKPLCRDSGLTWKILPHGKGYRFLPAPRLETPWIAFQGMDDQVCDAAVTEGYVKQVSSTQLVLLPKVGHGFSVQRNWMPQFKRAFPDLTQANRQTSQYTSAQGLADLPLVEVSSATPRSDTLAVLLSGDGGWARINQPGGRCAGRPRSERGGSRLP